MSVNIEALCCVFTLQWALLGSEALVLTYFTDVKGIGHLYCRLMRMYK